MEQLTKNHGLRVWEYVLAAGVVGMLALIFLQTSSDAASRGESGVISDAEVERVLPAGGIELPIEWDDLGAQMVASGVIDAASFESLYLNQGGLNEQEQQMLYGENLTEVRMTPENAGALLNMFWAFGLANKNPVLEKGPMQDEAYGGAQYFASTGGWTIAQGDVMNHYSAHAFVVLTEEQQQRVERVAKNIYRPCCGNSTYFPDCNHGMAMLGLLELLAAQGATEDEMYATALQVNAYWFPDTYLAIAQLFATRGSCSV